MGADAVVLGGWSESTSGFERAAKERALLNFRERKAKGVEAADRDLARVPLSKKQQAW